MTKIRTRIAPSPTGDPHVGTAYIALFNKVFAESQGGEFILRIEDTDQQRSSLESEQQIFKSLRWLGLDWSEGPDIGGKFAPYRQSERKSIYQSYADQLVEQNQAFHCFCSEERLTQLRLQQKAAGMATQYDGCCLQLSQDEVQAKLAQKKPHVIRMKIPETGQSVIKDVLRGNISIDWSLIDMQVLMKSDGLPTYHLASVVDDHLMEISHVIRGEEWISSTPKQLALYQYFGWQPPVYIHLPLLRNADKSKLSKRKNPTSITYYQQLGILPEALLNYLSMMGWTMPGNEELFSIEQMKAVFNIEDIALGGPIFDLQKLKWLNGRYIREVHTPDSLIDQLKHWKYNREYVNPLIELAQTRAQTLGEITPLLSFFFQSELGLDATDFAGLKLSEDEIKHVFQLLIWVFEHQRDWTKETIFSEIKTLVGKLDYKFKEVNEVLFLAITGSTNSVSVMDSMAILGSDMTRYRLQSVIQLLGGLGKKKLKSLEKTFQTLKQQATA